MAEFNVRKKIPSSQLNSFKIDSEANLKSSGSDFGPINICLRLNPIGQPRDKQKQDINIKTLKSKNPKFNEIETENLLEAIINEVFPAGFTKTAYLRNLTVKNDRILFAIRSKLSDGDFISKYLKKNQTLLFTGHKYRGSCYVDNISIIQETEKQSFEIEKEFYFNPAPDNQDNSFLECIGNLESIATNTEKNLQEWKSYLEWKKELASKQIHGAKYYDFKFDADTRKSVFKKHCLKFHTYDRIPAWAGKN